MLESTVEIYLTHGVELLDGLCEKLEHVRGAPDRLVTLPYLGMELVETKRPPSETDRGGQLMRHQKRDHQKRALRGVKVITLYTIAQVDEYLAERRAQIERLKKLPLKDIRDWERQYYAAARVMEHAQHCDVYGNDRTAAKKSKESQASLPL